MDERKNLNLNTNAIKLFFSNARKAVKVVALKEAQKLLPKISESQEKSAEQLNKAKKAHNEAEKAHNVAETALNEESKALNEEKMALAAANEYHNATAKAIEEITTLIERALED
jgi:hypothetical protein